MSLQKESEWEKELSEYGSLHNEDCCVHFPEDARACDVDTGIVDCCENMKTISSFVREILSKREQEIPKEDMP